MCKFCKKKTAIQTKAAYIIDVPLRSLVPSLLAELCIVDNISISLDFWMWMDVSAIAQSLDSLKWLSAHVPDTFHAFEDIFKEVQLCLLCQEIHGKK